MCCKTPACIFLDFSLFPVVTQITLENTKNSKNHENMAKITVLCSFEHEFSKECTGMSLCDQTLTDHVLSTKRDINKQLKALALYGRVFLDELNL